MARTRTASGLSRASFQELHAELRARQKRVVVIQRRRDGLVRRIAALDAEINGLGGKVGLNGTGSTGRKRPTNELTLVEALQAVLKGRTMRVRDVAEAVQKAGYQTYSNNFRTQVSIALGKNPKLFKRVGRGEYTAA